MTVAGSGLGLCVAVGWRGGQTVTSVTYDGVALTRIVSATEGVTDISTDIWFLQFPNVGTANIVTTLSGTPTWGFAVGAGSYTDVSRVGANATDNTDEKPMDVDIVTTLANSWVFSSGTMRDPLTVTEESPVTEHWNIESVVTTAWTNVGGDIPGPLSVGTHTPSWTYTQVVIQTAIAAIELVISTGPKKNSAILMGMGI